MFKTLPCAHHVDKAQSISSFLSQKIFFHGLLSCSPVVFIFFFFYKINFGTANQGFSARKYSGWCVVPFFRRSPSATKRVSQRLVM